MQTLTGKIVTVRLTETRSIDVDIFVKDSEHILDNTLEGLVLDYHYEGNFFQFEDSKYCEPETFANIVGTYSSDKFEIADIEDVDAVLTGTESEYDFDTPDSIIEYIDSEWKFVE